MNHGGETEPVDITEEWLRSNPTCVFWDPPLYYEDKCFQTCLVQGLNSAGRKDKELWYCVSRSGSNCGPVSRQNELLIAVHDRFNSFEDANAFRKSLYSDKADWNRYSPCLRMFCSDESSTRWSTGIDEATAAKILKQKHVICIQAAMPMDNVLYAWCEANNEYVQMYRPQKDEFVRPEMAKFRRVRTILAAVLRERPNLFLVGVLDKKMTFYIYDVIGFPPGYFSTRRTEFAQQPLLTRLQHIQAIVNSERQSHIGDCVKVAPFQAASSKQEMKLHSQIFIDSCDYPDVIRRVSGASGE